MGGEGDSRQLLRSRVRKDEPAPHMLITQEATLQLTHRNTAHMTPGTSGIFHISALSVMEHPFILPIQTRQ